MKDFKSKCKAFFAKSGKKVMGVMTAIMALAVSAVPAFAAVVPDTDIVAPITEAVAPITELFTFANVIKILGIVIAACALLYLLWWGLRKVIRMIKGGLKGKLSV